MTKFLNISVDNTLGGATPSDEVVSSQKAIKEYVDNNGGSVSTDGISINQNSSNELQTIGVINQNNSSQAINVWSGTKAEYDLLTPDPNTIYHITDDETPASFANTDLSNLSASGQAIIDGKANTSLNNLTSTGKNIGNWTTNTTNCVVEIPQDINVELNNGTLTLKAGSKVYVPNGSDVFDVVITSNDETVSVVGSNTFTGLIYYSTNDNNLKYGSVDNSVSGDSLSITDGYWYDTTNNIIKRIVSSAVSYSGLSFPLALVTVTSGSITSIDQVFNGFGYIGSVAFALKGVKCLIPNGRNPDGSLNSTLSTRNNVGVFLGGSSWTKVVVGSDATTSKDYVISTKQPTTNYTLWYNPVDNIMRRISGAGSLYSVNHIPIIFFERDANGKIIKFQAQPMFEVLYRDTPIVDGQWVVSLHEIASGVSGSSSYSTDFDLSSYLPNDGQKYEVLIHGQGRTGTSSGNSMWLWVGSSETGVLTLLALGQTRTSSYVQSAGSVIIPIGTNRKINLNLQYSGGTSTNIGVYAHAYRRTGTNS